MYSSGGVTVSELADRRRETRARIAQICRQLTSAETLVKGKACVFATGSFGRGEASRHSDLDVFIVARNEGDPGHPGESRLRNLDAICIKAALIALTRKLRIPEFSGDGRFLAHYSVHELTKTLGTEHDDVTNTFTTRLLLLLESYPLLEPSVHTRIKREVIEAYWRDYPDHKNNFIPAFLANDILRLWRTFCVNYEARTERVPKEEKAKGKLHNYKLKHSRLLTCYSALAYLLAIYGQNGTVTPRDALLMTELSPTQRLEWLQEQSAFARAHGKVRALVSQYERFLSTTNADKRGLVRQFMRSDFSRSKMNDAYTFGDTFFEVLTVVGGGSKFHRLIVV